MKININFNNPQFIDTIAFTLRINSRKLKYNEITLNNKTYFQSRLDQGVFVEKYPNCHNIRFSIPKLLGHFTHAEDGYLLFPQAVNQLNQLLIEKGVILLENIVDARLSRLDMFSDIICKSPLETFKDQLFDDLRLKYQREINKEVIDDDDDTDGYSLYLNKKKEKLVIYDKGEQLRKKKQFDKPLHITRIEHRLFSNRNITKTLGISTLSELSQYYESRFLIHTVKLGEIITPVPFPPMPFRTNVLSYQALIKRYGKDYPLAKMAYQGKSFKDYEKTLIKKLRSKGRTEGTIKNRIRDARNKWNMIKFYVSPEDYRQLYGSFHNQIYKPIDFMTLYKEAELLTN